MSRSDSHPAARSSAMVGARSRARFRARAIRTARPAARCLAVRQAPRSPPSFTPRRLAAARAALVRADMSPASSSATSDHLLQQELAGGALDHWPVNEPHIDARVEHPSALLHHGGL